MRQILWTVCIVSRSPNLCRAAPAGIRAYGSSGIGTIIGSLVPDRAAGRALCARPTPTAFVDDCARGAGA